MLLMYNTIFQFTAQSMLQTYHLLWNKCKKWPLCSIFFTCVFDALTFRFIMCVATKKKMLKRAKAKNQKEEAGDGRREATKEKKSSSQNLCIKKEVLRQSSHRHAHMFQSDARTTYTGAHALSGSVRNCDSLNKINVVLVTDWY